MPDHRPQPYQQQPDPNQPYGQQPYSNQPPPPPGQYPGQYGQQETRKHSGLATASLVLGIIGFIFGCIPFVNYVAFPIVLLAIVFGLIAFKWGKAKAGAILGVLGLVATILWSVAIAGAFNHASKQVDKYQACIDKNTDTSKCDKYLNN